MIPSTAATTTIKLLHRPLPTLAFAPQIPLDPTTTAKSPTRVLTPLLPATEHSSWQLQVTAFELCIFVLSILILLFLLIRLFGIVTEFARRRGKGWLGQRRGLLPPWLTGLGNWRRCRCCRCRGEKEDCEGKWGGELVEEKKLRPRATSVNRWDVEKDAGTWEGTSGGAVIELKETRQRARSVNRRDVERDVEAGNNTGPRRRSAE
jgi:hypothetical protein